MRSQRGPFVDMLYGVAYPLLSGDVDPAKAVAIREDVAAYCMKQAKLNKRITLTSLIHLQRNVSIAVSWHTGPI